MSVEMSDDESRHGHLPTAGDPIFSENGSETMDNDQTGLPSWAAALTAQMQTAFAFASGTTGPATADLLVSPANSRVAELAASPFPLPFISSLNKH